MGTFLNHLMNNSTITSVSLRQMFVVAVAIVEKDGIHQHFQALNSAKIAKAE